MRKSRNQKLKTVDITLRTHTLENTTGQIVIWMCKLDMVAPNRHYRFTYVKREDQLFFAEIG